MEFIFTIKLDYLTRTAYLSMTFKKYKKYFYNFLQTKISLLTKWKMENFIHIHILCNCALNYIILKVFYQSVLFSTKIYLE